MLDWMFSLINLGVYLLASWHPDKPTMLAWLVPKVSVGLTDCNLINQVLAGLVVGMINPAVYYPVCVIPINPARRMA